MLSENVKVGDRFSFVEGGTTHKVLKIVPYDGPLSELYNVWLKISTNLNSQGFFVIAHKIDNYPPVA